MPERIQFMAKNEINQVIFKYQMTMLNTQNINTHQNGQFGMPSNYQNYN